ncbi:MAG: hypothetical protein V4651_01605 [Bacteroidota bacterium]
MKKIFFIVISVVALASCGGETKPTHAETQAVENQVEKDQAAMDSMEKVIQQQIDSVSDDSLMDVKH